MKILIACEQSGTVREAFRALGYDAWSCDILPSDDMRHHHQCDVLEILKMGWKTGVGHPPCENLTNSAAWAYKDPDFARYPGVGYHQKLKPGTLFGAARRKAREEAVAFFLSLWNCPIERMCLENPIGHMNTHPAMAAYRPQMQIVQPYEFGDDASKATCLWLRGLPWLTIEPAKRKEGRWVMSEGKLVERWSNQTDSGQNKLTPTDERASVRAVTYSGIATAMAQQWGAL